MINKQALVRHLEEQGEQEAARQVEKRLPDTVHVGQHAVQLREIGLDPQQLAQRFGVNPAA